MAKCASSKKSDKTGETVFVQTAQAVDSSRQNAIWYGEVVSGITVYAYVRGNPLSRIDPFGLADMNLFPPGSTLEQATNLWNPTDYYSISGHGTTGGNVYDSNTGQVLTPADLAARIGTKNNGKPIYLDACNAGKGKNSYAQRLADLLGVPVVAPTDLVITQPYTSARTGAMVSFTESVANGGSYQTYTPSYTIPYNFGVTGKGW